MFHDKLSFTNAYFTTFLEIYNIYQHSENSEKLSHETKILEALGICEVLPKHTHTFNRINWAFPKSI